MKIAVLGRGKLGSQIVRLASQFSFEVVDFEDADIVIDATAPEVALEHIFRALEADKPIVVATTGWYDSIPLVAKKVQETNGFCLYSPNFSPMIQNLLQILPQLRTEGFQCSIEETHHVTKKDAPSGTALFLSQALGGVPIQSNRVEDVVGVHKIVIQNGHEKLTLNHQGFDRSVYAQGLLKLLSSIKGKSGMYELTEFLCLSPH
ncbi:MAG: 4-hydroxy-tetrahydrodipicolinate reductase [Chlamydiia bacterium]